MSSPYRNARQRLDPSRPPPPQPPRNADRMYVWKQDTGEIVGYVAEDGSWHDRADGDPRHVSEITHIVVPMRPPPRPLDEDEDDGGA